MRSHFFSPPITSVFYTYKEMFKYVLTFFSYYFFCLLYFIFFQGYGIGTTHRGYAFKIFLQNRIFFFLFSSRSFMGKAAENLKSSSCRKKNESSKFAQSFFIIFDSVLTQRRHCGVMDSGSD